MYVKAYVSFEGDDATYQVGADVTYVAELEAPYVPHPVLGHA